MEERVRKTAYELAIKSCEEAASDAQAEIEAANLEISRQADIASRARRQMDRAIARRDAAERAKVDANQERREFTAALNMVTERMQQTTV